MGGLGLVAGFLLNIQQAFASADLARCSARADDVATCITRRLIHGAGAIAPTVIALGLLGLVAGFALARLAYPLPSDGGRRPAGRRRFHVVRDGERRAVAEGVEPGRVLTDQPTAERLAALKAMPYRDGYLRTPEWRRTRAVMLARAADHCQLNARHTESLDVHHCTYDRLGQELVSDLTVLCRDCHTAHHDRERAAKAAPSVVAPAPTVSEPAPSGALSVAEPMPTTPFVVPLDWATPKPAPKQTVLRRLFPR